MSTKDKERIEKRAEELYNDWQAKSGFSITYELEQIGTEERTLANTQLAEQKKLWTEGYDKLVEFNEKVMVEKDKEIAGLKNFLNALDSSHQVASDQVQTLRKEIEALKQALRKVLAECECIYSAKIQEEIEQLLK